MFRPCSPSHRGVPPVSRALRGAILGCVCAAALLGTPQPGLAGAPPSLVLAIGGESEEGYDPIRGWGAYGSPLFQSTLLRFDADLELVGDLATAWSLSQDGLVWTISLRDDARFSDGAPLTAEDVAFTFETAAAAAGLADLSVLERAEIVDAQTVRLRLKQPRITFTRQLQTLGIVPKHAYGDGYARNPLGSGPYRLVEWVEGAQLVVEANPHWHGGDLAFERLTFLFPGADARLALIRSGEAHLVALPPALAGAPVPGARLVSVPTVDNRGVMFPMVPDEGRTNAEGRPIGNDVTSDLAIRRAVNLALDREALVTLALNGEGAPACGPTDGLPWDNPDACLPRDVAAAEAALDAGGWALGDDGLRRKDGLAARFTLTYPSTDPTRQALALGVAQQMREIGVAVEPSGKPWSEITPVRHSTAVLYGWGAHDPQEVWNLYHASRAGLGHFNAGFFENAAVDAHLDAAQAAPSFAASLEHWKAAAWDGTTGYGMRGDAAWAWLVNINHTYLASDCLDLGAIQPQPHGHGWPITAGVAQWTWTCE